MAYSSYNAIVEQFGEQEVIRSSDRDGNGVADVGVIDRALVDASSEIDSYLGAVYKLPLNPVPGIVDTYAGVIAIYRLSMEIGTYTVEKRKRYEDAIRWLRDVASGKASLDGAVVPEAKAGGVRYFTVAREYSVTQMGGIL